MWIDASPPSFASGHELLWVILYVGPDLMLPLTSAFAAIAGVVLMFWHRVVGALRVVWHALFARTRAPREQ